jgi:aquaporin Z
LVDALRKHWPEYLIEAGGLGAFMVSAIAFTVLLEHPSSPVHGALPDPVLRRVLMGLAMGGTSIALVYSRYGKRSGAHFNPALTFTFLRLGKLEPADALFYGLAQFAGGVLGVLGAAVALGALPQDPHVNFAVTVPGTAGAWIAFAAELAISFGLMFTVLLASNQPGVARFTGLFAGALVATYISLEAPLSGMSMNPARTLGSASAARTFEAIWIYFAAPPLGMLLAAETYVRLRSAAAVRCAKLHHQNRERCIFRCGYRAAA